MSYGFLSTTRYLGLVLIVSIILLCAAIKRRNKDRKGLIVLYLTISIGSILIGVIRVLKETTDLYYKYFDNIGYFAIGYVIIIFIELFYLSVTHKGDEESRKNLRIAWGIIVATILIGLLMYFLLD